MHANHYLCSECGHTNMWHWLDGKGCNSPKVDEKCSCTGFKNSGRYEGQDDHEKALAVWDRITARWFAEGRKPIEVTLDTRPSPADVGEALAYDTESRELIVSDGKNWRDRSGLLT